MAGKHLKLAASRRWRLAVVVLGLAVLATAALLWHPSSEAGGTAFKPLVTAIAKGKQLEVAVALPTDAAQRVSGTLAVELLSANGQRLANASTELRDSDPSVGHRLVLNALPAANETARLRVSFAGQQAEEPLAKAMLVKAHEMSVTGGLDFHVGTPATLSCNVHGVRSALDSVPLPGSEVIVRLRDKAGHSRQLYKGRTGSAGRADIQLDIPDVEPGAYTLEVASRSALGEEKIERPVRLSADAKVMLVSDRPIYQPGHIIHLRALALRPFDMRPVADKDVLFEVEDPKGNKVFRRTFKTSPYGVAFVDFQLADEVNMGDYHLRAVLADTRAEKTVQVKRYVLPKFKTEVKADKRFYLPKETVRLELQSDYFFGKPVAGAKVEVVASTFDVAFHQFHTWKGETDANGHATLEIKLPDYFVGQPLQKGDALVKLDVKIVDTADHAETATKTYPVSDQPVRVSLIAEGGKIVPNMENRIFAAATYPDGTPAPNCEITLWHEPVAGIGQPGRAFGGPMPGRRGGIQPAVPVQVPAAQQKPEPKRQPLGTVTTNAAGLAEITLAPKADQLRTGNWGQHDVELLGGKQQRWGPQILFDVIAAAKDARGNTARVQIALNSQPMGENVLLRLDKAIYQAGDRLGIDIRTSAGLPTVYVDIVRGGQIMLSKWLEVKDGKAMQTLDLPQSVFGSLEIHAYQMLHTGEIIRDSRVVYVQPRNDLKVTVAPGKAEFAPGEDAMIRFNVTDAKGAPTAAAIGVIIVDEAVYALQDLQPGLEKVYFTLQEELLKPQVQIKLGAGETIDNLVIRPALPAAQQQVAEVLLTAVKLPAPKRFIVDPAQERQQRVEGQLRMIGSSVLHYAAQTGKEALRFDKGAGRWEIRPDLLDDMVNNHQMPPQWLDAGLGSKLTVADLGRLEKGFAADDLGRAITAQRMSTLLIILGQYTDLHRNRFLMQGEWELPATLIDEALKATKNAAYWGQDAWGRPMRLVRLEKKAEHDYVPPQLVQYELISAGPDGKLSSGDDVRMRDLINGARRGWLQMAWWRPIAEQEDVTKFANGFQFDRAEGIRREMLMQRAAMPPGPGGFGGGFGGIGGGAGPGVPRAAAMPLNTNQALGDKAKHAPKTDAGGSAAPRVRELFPETMLWQPALITDDKGEANLALSFADSITTWRLSASANSRGGALGGATAPLKVFQDFFVDIDLPVNLTQGDEIAFPVAVYNYLKTPQTVKIELQKEGWFDLLDGGGLVRSLDLKPSEVTSVKFRIRAAKLGMQPLTVKAFGSKKSDAVKRLIEVAPNGQKIEKVATDRLKGKATQAIAIPENAVPDASKLIVRIYPGVMAQVLEGVDGLLRLPGGCMEQTSSSAYPNVLIADYVKKARLANPKILMKAEHFLNVGYQRLLTFERPGGGFDWWGNGEPLIWLSAYGLAEFNDMAKVYPIDRGVIDRTQAFLMRKMDKDGTWSAIGATHGETIANMGNPKLLLTSYVVWSMLESGYDRKQLQKSVQYIRDNLAAAGDSAYILALAANALAAYEPKDDRTLEAIRKLDKLRQEVPDWKAVRFPGRGMSLTYAHGDGVTVETTALAALAMIRTGEFTNDANQALTYLIKAKAGNGTWGSTQATILALKALIAGMGATPVKGTTNFTISVNGKEAARGKVDPDNADVMQTFDLAKLARTGNNQVEIAVDGETNLMYQIVGRYYEPWRKAAAVEKPVIEVAVDYDRTKLATNDLLHAKATLKYHGKVPTYMVMLDLGIAPGFTVDPGDFAEMVAKKQVQKFSITARQVTLYLGDVKPGDVLTFDYTLKARHALRARTAPTVAYEGYTPANRAEAAPVELIVEDRK